jgi:hypothetical protein
VAASSLSAFSGSSESKIQRPFGGGLGPSGERFLRHGRHHTPDVYVDPFAIRRIGATVIPSLPAIIKISDLIPPDKRSELLAAMSGMFRDGLTVAVSVDASGIFEKETVWRVVVDGYGYHASTRIEREGTAPEWAAALAALMPPAS